MIRCDICPYCKDLYPNKFDHDGHHYKICGMGGNMVYTKPRRVKKASGNGWIYYGISSCMLFETVDQALDRMTEIERERNHERMNQND